MARLNETVDRGTCLAAWCHVMDIIAYVEYGVKVQPQECDFLFLLTLHLLKLRWPTLKNGGGKMLSCMPWSSSDSEKDQSSFMVGAALGAASNSISREHLDDAGCATDIESDDIACDQEEM
ncbi:hypothetical protein MHYP_G00057730 [Metynnis hypsauchen]